MFSINKEEAEAVRKNFPNVYVVRTMKQKSKRGRYFCEESKQVIKFLDEFRNSRIIEKKAGGENKHRKKAQ